MFSCLVFCAKPDGDCVEDLLVAERVSLDLQVVSNAGRGSASCTYRLEKKCKDLIAYVPSSICIRGVNSQQVKVTHCQVELQSEEGISHSTDLQLVNLLDGDYPRHAKSLPSYVNVRKSLRRLVSQEDLILHLGNFEADTVLSINFEFLLQLKLVPAAAAVAGTPTITTTTTTTSTHTPAQYCIFENSIPSKQTSYNLRFASPSQVASVCPASSSLPLANFSWLHVDRTKQVVQVNYDTKNFDLGDESPAAICMELAAAGGGSLAVQSACCSCLMNHHLHHHHNNHHHHHQHHRNDHSRSTPQSNDASPSYDGIMMLSTRLTRSQLVPPGGEYTPSSSPCEFVFLVDCSASMNQFIDSVIATLIMSIKSLPEGCLFNLIAFGSSFRQLFHESKEYSKTNVKYAVDFANQLKANLGGTELVPPLRWIYKKSKRERMSCQIFVITDIDQEVKDSQYMINAIRKHKSHARSV